MRIYDKALNSEAQVNPDYAESLHEGYSPIEKEFIYLNGGNVILNLATVKGKFLNECYSVEELVLKDGGSRGFDEPTNYEKDDEKLKLRRLQIWTTKAEAMEYMLKKIQQNCMFAH